MVTGIFGIVMWIASLLVLMLIIKMAIDKSRATDKLDELIHEIRLLRKEIKENKHIIDKRL
ncbi:hypothetical protein [Paenibacillus sp. MMS20-IR301]|uniref:hypothetical protein n=1 Tax=Paenibacillus sp. MMS20-IR301 TaxID=2895946 RepID=UPI0028E282B9|nr:hypothetical protein [Paenibacillus sp. MMS20-IR301]WNS45850.1 hypothetical protein LOS79_11445 [Paenibacillus sp. MMS20-IR301]